MSIKNEIHISDNNGAPFSIFEELYIKAKNVNQNTLDAMAVSTSFNNEVSSRFVNLKYMVSNELIFFTNYNSPKFKHIQSNPNVSCLIYWEKIKTQIRVSGTATASNEVLSDKHFNERDHSKNIAAISSNRSQKIDSYEDVLAKYNENMKNLSGINIKRPSNWGGVSINPSYFEFWFGFDTRLNKRESYTYENNTWLKSILEP